MKTPTEARDVIHIEQLEVFARIGVPEEERAAPQRLVFNITFWPTYNAPELADDVARTVDYAAVCAETKSFVQGRSDRLIETLANAMANHLLGFFEIQRITIELRKFILPDVDYVSVTVTRERSGRARRPTADSKTQVSKPKEFSRIKIENLKKRERPS